MVLAFIALLLPTLRVLLALLLSFVNFVEANVFLILLPDEHWIMAATVLVRTVSLALLAVEFLGQIWPATTAGRMRQAAASLTWAVMLDQPAVLVPLGLLRAAQAWPTDAWPKDPAVRPSPICASKLPARRRHPHPTK